MYQKTRNILTLVETMQGSAEGITLEDIQQRCDCSLRTAQRIIAELVDIFPAMNSFSIDGKIKRWRIPSNAISPLFTLQAEEMTALSSCIEYLKQQNMNQQAQLLKSLESKVKTVIQSSRRTKSLGQDIETLLKHEGLAFRQGPRFQLHL